MTASLQSAAYATDSGAADAKRPSGGREERSGCVIPHYVGPAMLLRHSLPAHPSQPLNVADLIRGSFKVILLRGYDFRFRGVFPWGALWNIAGRSRTMDTLINSTSISASRSCVNNVMMASLKSAVNDADSGHDGREAPFGRLREAFWLCHSSLCGAATLLASSFLARTLLAASELRRFNQSIHK